MSRFYIGNPSGICVEKGLKRLKYVPCDFKGVDPKPGDEKIFKTYHKTREMYLSEKMMMSLINKLERGGRILLIQSEKKLFCYKRDLLF